MRSEVVSLTTFCGWRFLDIGPYLGKESINFLCSCTIWHPCSLCAPLKLRWLLPLVTLPELLWRLLLAPRLEWCLLLPPVVHLPGKQVLFVIWVIWIPLFPVNSVGFLGWELEQSCWNTEMRDGWFSEKQSRRCGVDKFVSLTRLLFNHIFAVLRACCFFRSASADFVSIAWEGHLGKTDDGVLQSHFP